MLPKTGRMGGMPEHDNRPVQDCGEALRQSGVSASMADLQHRLERLNGTAKRLYERLAPVMHDVPPANGCEGKPESASCSLAAQIDGIGREVSALDGLLRDALERLEI